MSRVLDERRGAGGVDLDLDLDLELDLDRSPHLDGARSPTIQPLPSRV